MIDKECIDACYDCSKYCKECITDKTIDHKANPYWEVCSEFCEFVARLSAKGVCPQSVYDLCAKFCEKCAKECDKIDSPSTKKCSTHCKKCAELCHSHSQRVMYKSGESPQYMWDRP